MSIAQTFLFWLSISSAEPSGLAGVMYSYTNSPYVQQGLVVELGWGWEEEVQWVLLLTEVLTILCNEKHRIDEVPQLVDQMEAMLVYAR